MQIINVTGLSSWEQRGTTASVAMLVPEAPRNGRPLGCCAMHGCGLANCGVALAAPPVSWATHNYYPPRATRDPRHCTRRGPAPFIAWRITMGRHRGSWGSLRSIILFQSCVFISRGSCGVWPRRATERPQYLLALRPDLFQAVHP